MTHPLVWLTLRGYRNQFVRRLATLRRPRTLLALALGVTYFAFVIRQRRPLGSAALPPDGVTLILSALVLVGGMWAWIGPPSASPIAMTPAELFHLVPAPITRRALVLYKLGRWQVPLLLNALVLTLVLSSRSDPVSALRRVIAVWLLLTIFRLHRLLASLVRGHPSRSIGDSAAPIAIVVFGAYLCALAVGIRSVVPGDTGVLLQRLADLPALLHADLTTRLLLAPWRALVLSIALSRDGSSWAIHLGAPIACVIALVLLIVGTPHVLDDADAIAVDPASPGRHRQRRSRSPIMLGIRTGGFAAWAVAWRQLGPLLRRRRVVTVLIGCAVGVAAIRALQVVGLQVAYGIVVMMLIVWTALLVITGPLWMRFGIRRELDQLDRLHALPLAPRDLVLSFALASWLVALAVQMAMLAVVAFALTGPQPADIDVTGARAMVPWIAAVLPAITAAGAIVCELGAIWFPEWVKHPLRRGAGIDVLGANLVTLIGYLFGLGTVLLVPGAAAAGALWLLPLHPFVALIVFWAGGAASLITALGVAGRGFARMEAGPRSA